MKKNVCAFILMFLAAALFSGCSTVMVNISRYKKVGILEFEGTQGSPQSGKMLTSLLFTKITDNRYYSVTVMDKISPAQELALEGRNMGVDAVLFGSINSFSVESFKGEETVRKIIKDEGASHGGPKSRDRDNEQKPGEKMREKPGEKHVQGKAGKKVPSKIIYMSDYKRGGREGKHEDTAKEVVITRDYFLKKGYISASIGMVDTATGNNIVSESRDISVSYVAKTLPEVMNMPADDEILDNLMSSFADVIILDVSPAQLGDKRYLVKGKDDTIKTGVKYASSGNWEEAASLWMKEVPENPFALNNMGVYYETKGAYDKAEDSYQKAVELMPDNRNFLANLEGIRNSSFVK